MFLCCQQVEKRLHCVARRVRGQGNAPRTPDKNGTAPIPRKRGRREKSCLNGGRKKSLMPLVMRHTHNLCRVFPSQYFRHACLDGTERFQVAPRRQCVLGLSIRCVLL